jgi:transcriptional regulator with XRE-family HTH domain
MPRKTLQEAEPPDGAALQARRMALGISRAELARISGLSHPTVRALETGERKVGTSYLRGPNKASRTLLVATLDKLERKR